VLEAKGKLLQDLVTKEKVVYKVNENKSAHKIALSIASKISHHRINLNSSTRNSP